ncbi:MAG: diguanylate cyclase [Chloroflexota bacterium]
MADQSALPPLKGGTKLYIGASVAAAAATVVALASSASAPAGRHLALAIALALGVALALLFPINAGHREALVLETIAAVPAMLLFPPGIAVLIVLTGMTIAIICQPVAFWIPAVLRRRDVAQDLFNLSFTTLKVAAGSLTLAAVGWEPRHPDFTLPMPVVATIVAGLAMYFVDRLGLAGIIAFEEGVPLPTAFYDLTLGAQPVEHMQYAAQLGLGLLAAVIANAHPWALLLLLLPMAAIYSSLQRHVAMRRRAEANLAAAQEVALLGSLDWDLRKSDQRWSPTLYRLLGLDPETVHPSTEQYLAVVHPDDRSAVAAALDEAQRGMPYDIDHRIIRPDGEERVIHARGEVVPGRDGKPARIVGTLHDITERKRLEEQLAHRAFHDPLTDLPNRALFLLRLDEALARVPDGQPPIAVLFLDLDRFKLINDTLGHEAGDQLLIAVADRLRDSVRPADIVARLGGDEFTILLEDIVEDQEAAQVARRIIESMTKPVVVLGSKEMVISTSIGIVRPGLEHRRGADILRDADTALYRAKEGGRNRYAFFDATMGAVARERLALEADLRRALERGELRVLYQPKIDLVSGQPVAVEALVRWAHPERGWVPPLVFIPIAEETGLIGEIGSWVLETACREAVGWGRVLPNPPVLSVNFSSRQLYDPALPTRVAHALEESGLPPARLRLEVSESAAMKNADATAATLRALQKIGVRVVIDDFGTGTSSLSSLQRFPVDTLQIDQSLIAALGHSRDATTIAQAVVGLAHGLGLAVMAEGVERPDQLALLRALGCEQAQGNLFCPPIVADELVRYLSSPASWVLPGIRDNAIQIEPVSA